jgi:hypothetical protein
MPNISAGFLIGTLLAATLMLPVPLTHAWAASVTGHTVVGGGDDVLRIVSFSATSLDQQEGTATGRVDFHDPKASVDQDVDGTGDPALADAPGGVRLEAAVDCLFVDGNHAVVGGQVTSASVSRYVGMWLLLYVEDGDSQGTPDRFSWGFYPVETETGCGSFPVAAHSAVEIESGELRIRQ